MVTFKVDEVKLASEASKQTQSAQKAIEKCVKSSVEATSCKKDLITTDCNNFLSTILIAYNHHFPLSLSPDSFWLTIAQGLAIHINANAEALRTKFVNFDDKKKLWVRENSFVKGSSVNDWEHTFGEFSNQIKKHIGEENHANIVSEFSTTGIVERAANEVVLMDAMQSYFEYGVSTLCGLPSITLEGTAEDWNKVAEKTEVIGKSYNCQWWTNRLVPYLEMVAETAAGTDHTEMWQNFFKKAMSGSGDTPVNGWINYLFPYLKSYEGELEAREFDGAYDQMYRDYMPSGVSTVPFEWLYYDQVYPYEFLSGFFGAEQDVETLVMRPHIGWAVRPKQEENNEGVV